MITPNPKTSGGARWNYLAAWGYALRQGRAASEAKARKFVASSLRNVPVLDSGARGSTTTFVQRGIGDVLLAWENEALLAREELGTDKFEIVVPSMSILAEPPVAVVDKWWTGAARGRWPRPTCSTSTRRRARSWPPSTTTARARRRSPRSTRATSRSVRLFTVDEVFGGWKKAQKAHFDDGGVFDPGDGAPMRPRACSAVPGLRLSLGFTLAYLGALVVLPLGALVVQGTRGGAGALWASLLSPRALAAYRLSFGAALAAAAVNAVFGLVLAWVLVRYRFPGRRLADALVDLPFALPTAVAGIALTTLFAADGWLGGPLTRAGVAVAYAPAGVVVALTFIGVPFVVRSVQPVLEDLEPEVEEAAKSLGASGAQVFRRVVLPHVAPAWLTGVTLAFARAVGEYGSVVFISGNLPGRTEIVPFLIMTRLEQYDYAGATALAVAMLAASAILLGTVQMLEGRGRRRARLA